MINKEKDEDISCDNAEISTAQEQINEDNSVLEPSIVGVADPAECLPADNKYGKFENADTLYEAYKNLESEFTRRNQELSKAKQSSQELQGQVQQLMAKLENILSDNDFCIKAAANDSVYRLAVEHFLTSKTNETAVPVLTAGIGQTVAIKAAKPKTLEEASKLALALLR